MAILILEVRGSIRARIKIISYDLNAEIPTLTVKIKVY